MKKIIEYIDKYDPFNYISLKDEFYEEKFLEYLHEYKENLLKTIEKEDKKKVDKIFFNKIETTNDIAVNKIISNYLNNNIDEIDFQNMIRKMKNIILVSEQSTKTRKHILKIDKNIEKTRDKKNIKYNIVSEDDKKVDKLFQDYHPNDSTYEEDTVNLKKQISSFIIYYYDNYSYDMANKKIKILLKRTDKIIYQNASDLGIYDKDNNEMLELLKKYQEQNVLTIEEYENWIYNLRNEFDKIKNNIENKYSKKIANRISNKYYQELDKIIELKIKNIDLSSYIKDKLKHIQIKHDDNMKNIENEFQKIEYYWQYNKDESYCKKREIYENFFREYKKNVRKLNQEIKILYPSKKAFKTINIINKISDKYNLELAKKYNMPIPKNPWIIRKYLWADLDNFTSDKGNTIRNLINKPWRKIVALTSMKNKVIIEEEQYLNSNRPYIFVSTHYFTEDVIGLFSSLNRQAYMLMGTTDQIENNPLMIAAILFGFFHVDRMDPDDRKLCFEKQNNLIERGESFINYIAGSWENSENELQPLSFSGPYKTSVKTNALIVPVSSYLVREDKTIYMRFGTPLDLTKTPLEEANEIIRDTLATMHYKQIEKYSYPIKEVKISNIKDTTHDLPYNQHIAYMNQIGYEYWNQPWTKPFAKEEIGLRRKKITTEEEVYSFIDKLSRDKLIELSNYLADVMKDIDEKRRYDIINYLDENYEVFREDTKKKQKSLRELKLF